MSGSIPILLNSDRALLIGAGQVALQKAKVLNRNGISVDVVAKTIDSKIEPFCSTITCAKFKKRHTKGYRLVIDATGSKKVLKKVKKAQKEHLFLLNVVDNPKHCDVYFMALTKPDAIQIAVTSHGASPTLAKRIRDKCQELLGDDIQALAKELEEKRKEGIIDTESTQKAFNVGKVVLVGCGIGSLKDLTFRAYEAIKHADTYLYDHLLSDEIVNLLDKNKPHYFVGKSKGFHTKSQEQINALMLQLAKKGKRIARLKGGDPFVFGRGAEEVEFLASQGIEVEVIPGISAATAAPLSCFVPVTARGISDSFSVVSAHLRGNALNLSWLDLLKREKHTTVVLMGLSKAKQIKEAALDLGIDKGLPCAIVSNAARSDQTCIFGTIDELDTMASKAKRPTTIIFGDAVKFADKGTRND